MNDYERAAEKVRDTINDVEGLDVVDPDLEAKVFQARDLLEDVFVSLEERA